MRFFFKSKLAARIRSRRQRELDLRTLLQLHWQSIALYGGVFTVLGAALFWQLGSLLPGYSQKELHTYQEGVSLSYILDNPLYAPFMLLLRGLLYINLGNLLMTRVAAALFGFGTLILFFWLLRQWHGDRTAIAGTLLFGLSAWFLHTARAGTPEVLAYGVFALVACGFLLKQRKEAWVLLLCFGLAAMLLYVPGMLWFIVAGALWQWKTIGQSFRQHLTAVSVGGLLLLAALAPLAWALYKDTELLMAWLGLPDTWPSLSEAAKNILTVPYHLFIGNNAPADAWLGRAPILDVFSAAMCILGGYVYIKHIRLMRTPLLLTILVLGIANVAIGGPVPLSVIAPFVYLVIAAGVGHLIYQWFSVFPRNPIARGIGVTVFTIAVGIAIAYHVQHYFIGWPQAEATHNAFTITRP